MTTNEVVYRDPQNQLWFGHLTDEPTQPGWSVVKWHERISGFGQSHPVTTSWAVQDHLLRAVPKVNAWFKLPPHLDPWMRGVRYGAIVERSKGKLIVESGGSRHSVAIHQVFEGLPAARQVEAFILNALGNDQWQAVCPYCHEADEIVEVDQAIRHNQMSPHPDGHMVSLSDTQFEHHGFLCTSCNRRVGDPNGQESFIEYT